MSSFLLGAAILGLVYLIAWISRNDKADDISEQNGLLRMKPPPGGEKKDEPQRQRPRPRRRPQS